MKKKYKTVSTKLTNAFSQWIETSKELSTEYADVVELHLFTEINNRLSKIKEHQKHINNAEVITAIDQVQNKFNIRADTCVKDTTYIKSPVCDEHKYYCQHDSLFGVENMRLYVDRITPNYEIERFFINRVDEYVYGSFDNFQKSANTVRFQILFCGLLSTTTITMSPADINAVRVNSEILNLKPYVYSGEQFKDDCIEKKPSEIIVANMQSLLSHYPNNFSLKLDNDRYNTWIRNCSAIVRDYCTNTYIIRNTAILSYPTVGCEVRDVTETDIKSDMLLFSTDAEKLNHSTLLDTIDLCQKAYEDGYRWGYIKPAVPSACKKVKRKKS